MAPPLSGTIIGNHVRRTFAYFGRSMRHTAALVLLCTSSLLHAQDFQRDIAPILSKRCLECHSGPDPKGKLDLTTRAAALKGGKNGPALVPGNLDDSELWARVESGQMPPKKPLAAEEKKHLQAWIKSGAAWHGPALDWFARSTETRAGFDWWSLQPVKRPDPPRVGKSAWPRNPIDAFILARLEEKGLTPAAEADRRTLIRRVTFDLLGLPPTPQQMQDFLKDDRPEAYERLVDDLLASPHYGERWARHWLDVVRFAESHGFEHDELRKSSWPYRDWVIQALNKDLPYDEFVRLQIAGDLLGAADGLRATGFLVAGGYDSVGQRQQSLAMRAVVRQDELEDMVGTLGQTFLGLTVHCARCHDHKFDPIRQVEYYRLTAALAGVRHGERDLLDVADTAAQKRAAQARADLERLEAPYRVKILAERNKDVPPPGPEPLAHWDFTKGLDDRAGKLHAKVFGDAKQTAQGLILTGQGYAATGPLAGDLKARTLSVWITLGNLQQRGGAALSVQKLDGSTFDAIVFAEKEPGKWVAGSDFFRRSIDFGGPVESETKPVQLALVYHPDGSVAAFRNGAAYGKTTKPPGPITYAAGQAQILFGLRHSPPGGNKHLTGIITRAELFDRALSPAEVAALAGTVSTFVSEQELLARLSPEEKTRRATLLADIVAGNQSVAQAKTKVYAVAPAPPETTHLLRRGEPNNKAEEVVAAGLAAIGKADFDLKATATDAERRRKLAEWITAPNNPLLARVLVNRLWHYHFGQGIVDTPSDFGFGGGRPSHPELLDWLADEFVRQGWSVKKMHRLLVTSAAYRQSSRFEPAAAKVDAQNRLLWRKSPMRLEAEAVRDAVLSVSGKLNSRMFGPGYQDFKLSIRGATHYYTPSEGDSDDQLRRSIYRTWVRSGRNPLLDTLDCPDPSTVTPRRSVTTTPLQSLTLLNSDFMLRMADTFAARLQAETGKDVPRQIQRGYELALGRSPRPEEVALAERVIAEHGLPILCRALFNCNEFMYVD